MVPLYYKSVEKYAEQLASAEAIVAVYPTWWYGLPAMLRIFRSSLGRRESRMM